MARIRVATKEDGEFLVRMLAEMAGAGGRTPPAAELLADPWYGRYVADWQGPDDFGVVGEDRSRAPIGAAWVRRLTDGTADPDVPELAVAVEPDRRRAGLGGALLVALLAQARVAGYTRIGATVPPGSLGGLLLYRHGFVPVATSARGETLTLDLTAS